MNIKVEIIDFEDEVLENNIVVRRAKPGNPKKADAVMINVYENQTGILYAVIVMPDGSIEKIRYDLIRVVDNQYT